MEIKTFFAITILSLFLASCDKEEIKTLAKSSNPNSVYFNSFENVPLSTTQLAQHLSSDTPENGGDNSLNFVGRFNLSAGPFEEEMEVYINLFGKSIPDGEAGSSITSEVTVSLKSDPSKSIKITIQNSVWTQYTSNSTLKIPAGEEVNILFDSLGSFFANSGYCDLVDIIRVD